MKIRAIIVFFSLLVFLTMAVGGGIYFHSVREALRSDIVGDVQDDVQDFAKGIASSLTQYQRISAALAGLKELPTALLRKDPVSIGQATAILDHFQSTIQADVCYLIDQTGNTIASSNRNTPDSFVGKNFAFRPYFKDAILGIPAIYPALGVVTKKRGLFFSYPVYGGGHKQPLGVLVIKSSSQPIEKEINARQKGTLMLVDSHSIVFISNRSQWLYHSLWRIPREELSAVTTSQQFGEGPIEWIGLEEKDTHDAFDSKGKHYLLYQKEIANLPGWTARYLLASNVLSQQISLQFFRKFGSFLIVFCVVVGLAGLFLYRKADQEIRRRKLADDVQQQSLSLLQATLESTADGILVVNGAGEIVSFNARFAEMWRLPDDIMSSRDDREALQFVLDQLKDPQGFLAKVEALYAQPEQESFDILEFKDGRIFERSSMPHRMGDKIVGRVWSFRDVTERKNAQEKLKQSEEMLRNTLNNVDDGFLVIDRDLRIQLANETFSKWVAMQVGDIIGRRCYEITYKAFKACSEASETCAVRATFDTGMPQRTVYDYTEKDGNKTYIEIKTFPVKDASGNMTSVIEVLSNMTEKYLLEEERAKSQKLEAIGTLAGGIAHDFNNLLQGIFGYISIAKMQLDQKDKSLVMLEQAEKALHMSVNLTTQLLTFSKGGKPAKKLIALRPAIEDAASLALSGSRSDYHSSIDAGLWQAEADEGQIGQVIQNIVLNAAEAMPSGGTVEILARNVQIAKGGNPFFPEGGRFVKIAVTDSGVGIAEQYLPRIFDPYFTTKQKGSGLGLATAYSIIRNHGGVIDVASEAAKGSTFTIYLPASDNTKAKESQVSGSAAVRKGKILVMDDEEMVIEVARKLIETLGHEVEVAKDGEDAIEKYKQAKQAGRAFDIVILDLTVRGGLGGEDAVRKLHEIDPGVKAVVSSGYADAPVVSDYRSYGFAAFLNKPYTIDALNHTLNILLAS
ncbi:MAG: ATP-binding protein [Dissulfurispiraceae bacterium]